MNIFLLLFLCFTFPLFGAVPYSSGWHNVPGVETDVVEFMDQHPEVDLIFSYEGSWNLVDRLDRPRNTSYASFDYLDPDRAYWIHANPIHSIVINGDRNNIGISFIVSEEVQSAELEFSFSIDDGLSWNKSDNLTGSLNLNMPSDNNQIIWYSDRDILTVQDKVRIRFKMIINGSEVSGFSHRFTIDPDSSNAPSPTLLNFIPGVDDERVPTSIGRIDIHFSEHLLASSILNSRVKVLDGDDVLPTSISVNNDKLAILIPQKLKYDSQYSIQVDNSITSSRGVSLTQSYSWNFRTENQPNLNLFEIVPQEDWTETSIRKILHIFAFGGHATDEQISKWASMSPEQAIEEILTLYPVNYLLSPAQGDTAHIHARTLLSLSKHWSSTHSEVRSGLRHEYDAETELNAAVCTWITASTKSGLNPFFHKIGLFETNYHMAVNQDKDLSVKELIGYYDRIMTEHSKRTPYQKVLAAAAISPAIAQQYKHNENRFEEGQFFGNEDFAREIHQLFFGILGESEIQDPAFSTYLSLNNYDDYSDYHEFVSVRNTARALTDMKTDGQEDKITYGTQNHHNESLEILGRSVPGINAKEKIEELVDYDIEHPESLKYLPLIITKVLADDLMDETTEQIVSQAWTSMESKDFLRFLRSYAISTIFHNSKRVKFLNSFDRNLVYHNTTHHSNLVSYNDTSILAKLLTKEGALFFRPIHNVFGGQTGLEASESSKILKEAFNTSSTRHGETIDARGVYGQKAWERDWGVEISRQDTNDYEVRKITEFLWQKLIADGLKNLGVLERAEIYALLAEGKDFSNVVDSNNPDRIYSTEEILSDPDINSKYQNLSETKLNYLDNYKDNRNINRWEDNYRIGMALAFMAATPYMFAQEGL